MTILLQSHKTNQEVLIFQYILLWTFNKLNKLKK